MDALQPESFSYRWLVSVADEDSAAAFIDIDPRLMSMRWSGREALEDFHLLDAEPPTPAHAGEIFQPPALAAFEEEVGGGGGDRFPSADSELSRSASLDSTTVLLSLSRRYGPPSPRSGATPGASPSWPVGPAPKKILRKYLCFLLPLMKKVKLMGAAGGRRARSGEGGLDRCRRPGRATVAAVVDEGLEKSIHEAVLHCKKSIGA